jgi:hypothetical protein
MGQYIKPRSVLTLESVTGVSGFKLCHPLSRLLSCPKKPSAPGPQRRIHGPGLENTQHQVKPRQLSSTTGQNVPVRDAAQKPTNRLDLVLVQIREPVHAGLLLPESSRIEIRKCLGLLLPGSARLLQAEPAPNSDKKLVKRSQCSLDE